MASHDSFSGDVAIADLFLLPSQPALPDVLRTARPAPILRPAEIARLIRDRCAPEDGAFDRYLPSELRSVSSRHWTPLAVVAVAAEWLRTFGVRTVVDVGSGAGKFCVAGALASDSSFVGIERRPTLVQAARRLARAFDVDGRARFLEGTFGEDEIPPADAYYLFNPFAENLFGPAERIDEDESMGYARYKHDIEATRRFLAGLPTGTFVLTYHGFGGRLPTGFTCVRVDRSFTGDLRMWKKTRKQRNTERASLAPVCAGLTT